MQSQYSPSEQKREVTPFELICRAAEAQDEGLLQQARSQAHLFAYSAELDMRTVSFLAYQKKMAAVKFLQNRGASKIFLAAGFARAGEMELAYSYLEETIQDNPKRTIHAISVVANSVGYCQDKTKSDDFLGMIIRKYPDYSFRAFEGVAGGVLLNGKLAEMDVFLEKTEQAGYGLSIKGFIERMASGLQASGQAEKMKQFLIKVKIQYGNCYYSALAGQAAGYAIQGKVEESLAVLAVIKSAPLIEATDIYELALASVSMDIALAGQCDRIEAFIEGALSMQGNYPEQILPKIAATLGYYRYTAQAAWFRLYVERNYFDELPYVLRFWAGECAFLAGSADIEELIETIETDYPPIPRQASLALPALMGLLERLITDGTPSELRHWLGVIVKEGRGIRRLNLISAAATTFVEQAETADEFHIFLDFIKKNHATSFTFTVNFMASSLGYQARQMEIDAFMKCVSHHYPRYVPHALHAIAQAENRDGRCTSQELILRTLTGVADETTRTALAVKVDPQVYDYDLSPVLSQANRLASGKREFCLSYDQLQAWLQVEIRYLLLYGMVYRDTTGKAPDSRLQALPDELLLNIVRFLAPLTWRSVDNLAQKLSFAFSGLFGQPKGLAAKLLAGEHKPTPPASLRPPGS